MSLPDLSMVWQRRRAALLWVGGILLVLFALLLGFQGLQLQRARAAAYAADTARTNAQARASVTLQQLMRDHGQTVRVATRQAEQQRLELAGANGELARERKEKATARAELAILQDSLRRIQQGHTGLVAVAGQDTGTVTLGDHLDARDSLGLSVDASAELAGVPVTAVPAGTAVTWQWSVVREPIPLTVDWTCNPGERTAIVRVTSLPWARVNLERVQQDPQTCAPAPRAWEAFSWKLPSLPWLGVAGLVGGLLTLVVVH